MGSSLCHRLLVFGKPRYRPQTQPQHSAPLAQAVILAAQLFDPTPPHNELEVNIAGRQGTTVRRPCGNSLSSHVCMGQRCQHWGKLNHKPPTPKPNLHPICGLCTVEWDSMCLPLLPDAAVCRSLFKSTVLRLFLQQTIKVGAEELYGYGHTKIGMVGTANFQVSCHGTKLLGFDLFCVLGFSITDNMGSTKLTITMSWQHCWLSLFTWLDCLTTFNHQPLIGLAVSSVIQTLHRLA